MQDKGSKGCGVSVLVNYMDAVVQREVSQKCGKNYVDVQQEKGKISETSAVNSAACMEDQPQRVVVTQFWFGFLPSGVSDCGTVMV